MCKKLSVFCLLLAATVASANPITATNQLRVDIDGGGNTNLAPGFQSWLFPRDFTGAQSKTFNTGGPPVDWPTLEYQYVATMGAGGGSRDRAGGMVFVGGTGAIGSGAGGFGRNYAQLKLTNLESNKEYEFLMWSWERNGVWVVDVNNPNRKYGVWSTTNANAWLVANGYSGKNGEPNGYGPKGGYTGYPIPPGTTESNMPAGLAALALANGGRIFMQSPADTTLPDWYEGDSHYVRFRATASASGVITLYGWMDATDWGGSMHMPLNGLIVIPEPATVALLGLGGLALLRRKRA